MRGRINIIILTLLAVLMFGFVFGNALNKINKVQIEYNQEVVNILYKEQLRQVYNKYIPIIDSKGTLSNSEINELQELFSEYSPTIRVDVEVSDQIELDKQPYIKLTFNLDPEDFKPTYNNSEVFKVIKTFEASKTVTEGDGYGDIS